MLIASVGQLSVIYFANRAFWEAATSHEPDWTPCPNQELAAVAARFRRERSGDPAGRQNSPPHPLDQLALARH
ncbi:hypothetical protein AB0D57_46765, partial [Streptomyces sp. NPDC048275]